jgi:hypothetical protein
VVAGPDETIVGLLDLIEALEPPARQAWDNADQRAFNIGINAGAEPYSSIYAVKPQTLKRLAAISGMLEVTAYAPQRPRRVGSRENLPPRSRSQPLEDNRWIEYTSASEELFDAHNDR